ncbi:5-hydroxytryptamine receptor 3A-like [Genypterus blacodes]|uniref:5-hydroxytryptamine receptor 3A-like n=1 Tax=Genypterus blacodes TaxID=154954 RepID=UPI003F769E63
MTAAKPSELLFLCFVMLHGFVAALNCSSPTPEALFDELEKNLFNKKNLRPVQSFSIPLNVTVSITVVALVEVDEKKQNLETFIWQVLEWKIQGLSWDAKECGTNRVSILREKLWLPDITIAEFMEGDNSPKTPYVYLYNTGLISDDKPVRVVSSCKLGIYTFPFDVQNCTLSFGSYIHFGSDIIVYGVNAEAILQESLDVFESNGEWELVNIQAFPHVLALESGSFSELKYHIILRRRPMLYVVNLLIPSCFLITVDLFSFLLPPENVDRSSFKMTLILGYTVFLLIMNDLLPVTGNSAPLMNVFFSISLALMVGSLLETLFITKIHYSSSLYAAVPPWISVLVLQYLARVVCVPPKKPNRVTVCLGPAVRESKRINGISNLGADLRSISGNVSLKPPLDPKDPVLAELKKMSRELLAIRTHIDKHLQGTNTSQEWNMVGRIIDRLLFGLYVIFISVSFITMICIWLNYKSYSP